jgi:hypothetical protein
VNATTRYATPYHHSAHHHTHARAHTHGRMHPHVFSSRRTPRHGLCGAPCVPSRVALLEVRPLVNEPVDHSYSVECSIWLSTGCLRTCAKNCA